VAVILSTGTFVAVRRGHRIPAFERGTTERWKRRNRCALPPFPSFRYSRSSAILAQPRPQLLGLRSILRRLWHPDALGDLRRFFDQGQRCCWVALFLVEQAEVPGLFAVVDMSPMRRVISRLCW
jgi:hypothetical protein